MVMATITRVTRATTVKEAVESSAAARELFIQHGIDPLARCVGMDDLNTLGGAEDWCHIMDVDGLIAELHDAIASERTLASTATRPAPHVPPPAP
jgi:hypothetical protein